MSWHHQESSRTGRYRYAVPGGAASTPKAYGRSYSPVGVVFVPCARVAPSASPAAPKRAGADPARTHRPSAPPSRSHHVSVPVVAPVSGATAVISWVPPPVSAIRSGSGRGADPRAGTAPTRRREADTRAATAPGRMGQTLEGGSGSGSPGRPSMLEATCSFLVKYALSEASSSRANRLPCRSRSDSYAMKGTA